MPHGSQEVLIVVNRLQFAVDIVVQRDGVGRGGIAQPTVLQPTPQWLDWVQHGCIGRQSLQGQSRIESLQRLVNRISLMHRSAVPNNDQSFRNLPHQRFQEDGDSLVVEVFVDQGLIHQPQRPASPWRPRQSACNRDLFSMLAALLQNRSLPARRPSAANQRGHQKATFVDKNHTDSLGQRFFLIRCHSFPSHAAMTSGFRSRGTRSGFCGEKPRAASQRGRYRRLKLTSHSSWISSANRPAVQSSVMKPCSVGLCLNHRRTIFSCVRVNLLGRPLAGWANSARQPCRRNALNHRRTLLRSTSRNSETSSELKPSSSLRTASNRRCSSSAGEPLLRIQST